MSQRQATQEDCRHVVRSCREKIRKAKAQLELSLATVVRDKTKCFCKYINNKKRAKEYLHPLLYAGENIATKKEDKAESTEGTGGGAGQAIICQWFWLTREVPDDWRLTNVTPVYKKGQKEYPGNYRPVSLTSVPGRIVERFILSVLTRQVQDNRGSGPASMGS